MAERGAVPQVPALRRRALGLIRSFTSPLLPDDYLELVNPLWSTRELRGRVERVEPASADAVTVLIKPGWEWPGHRPGQYLRLGIEVDGRHHWRAYSLTSEPGRADGCISITPKLVPSGRSRRSCTSRLRPGAIVRLGGVEGAFTLPDPLPARLLFLSAGSGITPIASMLRALAARGELVEVVHVHSTRAPEQFVFGGELRELDRARPGYRLHEWTSSQQGRLDSRALARAVPRLVRARDLPVRTARAARDDGRALARRRRPGAAARGALSAARARRRGRARRRRHDPPVRQRPDAVSDGEQPILVAGEQAGATMPFGCRMGICHSCTGRLRTGRVRDLRTGRVHGQPGELLQTCINAPEGPVEIDL